MLCVQFQSTIKAIARKLHFTVAAMYEDYLLYVYLLL